MDKNNKIYVAGHTGLVGSAIIRELTTRGYTNIIHKELTELDLRNQHHVNAFFSQAKPDYVFLAAARVGGILANSTKKAEFFYDNMSIALNVIHASLNYKVKKLLNLGSSCIYPRHAPQPLKEEYLLTGALEPTNDAYALAKIAAIKMCRYYNEQYGTDFISVMPTNLFGINDNFDLQTSHLIPALIRKMHEAKLNNTQVTLWGDGSPYRECLYVDDLARAVVFLMRNHTFKQIGEFINIGTGEDMSIKEIADLVAGVVGYRGIINWDTSKPNGMPRKLLDVSKIKKLGWEPHISLEQGIRKTYKWYISND
ncbi:MAG: GDP-L-fucose synthase [Spirochaetales bacterium]|nr:GDP-L-fucose synthase [Spirochaetales bacterium]